MGHVDASGRPDAIEVRLSWGPVVRGVRWGDGPDVVLFLHEPGSDLDAWGGLPSRMARILGAAAVAIDLPGHGLSDDPWEPERAGELVGVLVERATATDFAVLPPSPIAIGERDGSLAARLPTGRRYIIAAGVIASAVHANAAHLALAGIVSLSPAALLPPPIATGEGADGARVVPKLMFAGSFADDDLATARRLASAGAGWTAVTSIPVPERGTGLLATLWHARIEEEIVAFVRDCQHCRPGVRPGPRATPRPFG